MGLKSIEVCKTCGRTIVRDGESIRDPQGQGEREAIWTSYGLDHTFAPAYPAGWKPEDPLHNCIPPNGAIPPPATVDPALSAAVELHPVRTRKGKR